MTDYRELIERLPELRKLAEAATPGPWSHSMTTFRAVWDKDDILVAKSHFTDDYGRDAAFIAACDPQTILMLADALSELLGKEERMTLCVNHALMVLPVPSDGQGKRAWASLLEAKAIGEGDPHPPGAQP